MPLAKRTAYRLLLGLCAFGLWTLGVRHLFRESRLLVEVEMASLVSGQMQLFADDGRGFREARSARARVFGDGRLETYRLILELDRTIHALRLDPLNAPGSFRIRAITVAFAGRIEHFEGPSLAEWQPTHQLLSVAEPDGQGLLSQGTDPRLVIRREIAAVAWWARPPTAREWALGFLGAPFLLLALGGPWPRRAEHGLALATPLGLFAFLNLRVLDSWWIHDDPCLIAAALRGGIGPHFFEPEVWRALSGSVLMPWTIFSLGLDERLFGLEPTAFYAHQLLAFCVLLATLYFLLRTFLSAPASCLASTLFAVSAPSFAVAERLMNRHYLEGLILFLGALALYLRALRTERMACAFAGAGLYLLATTAKEVFVPLVAVLPFMPVGRRRTRFRSILPFAAAAALYVPWRLYMLGWENSLSGYAAKPGNGAPDIRAALAGVGLEQTWQLVFGVVLAATALIAVARRAPDWFGAGALLSLTLALPLLPVLEEVWPRYFFLPALALAILVGAGFEPWFASRRTPAVMVGVGLLVFSLDALVRSPLWRGHTRAVERHRTEGEFVLESSSDGVLLTRINDTQYLSCLAEIRRNTPGKAPGPGFCGDACWCATAYAEEPFWSAEGSRIVAAEALEQEPCATDRELSVEMRYDRGSGRLAWRLGPYRVGTFEVLLVSGTEPPEVSVPTPITAAGEAPLTVSRLFRWIVRYRSKDGWQTYSPVLTLDPAAGPLRWHRPRANAE